MATARKRRDPDIRSTFGCLSDDVLIDDGQFADVAGRRAVNDQALAARREDAACRHDQRTPAAPRRQRSPVVAGARAPTGLKEKPPASCEANGGSREGNNS